MLADDKEIDWMQVEYDERYIPQLVHEEIVTKKLNFIEKSVINPRFYGL